MSLQTTIILISIGLLAGILSGFVGIGGGVIIVPALVYFLGFSQHLAQGTSLFILLLPVGILAVSNYYKSGFINWKFGLIVAVFNNVRWLIFSLLAIPIGLMLALFVNQKILGMRYIKSLFYFPFVINAVVIGVIFTWFYNPKYGALAYVLGFLSKF